MERIIDWLISMEDLARDFYQEAARAFENEKRFSSVLLRLAEDEKSHHYILRRADECLQALAPSERIQPPVYIDEETKKKISVPMEECMKKIKKGEITKEGFLDSMLEVELSEMNDVFLYVMNSFRECSSEFVTIASDIQRHRRHIERFLEMQAGGENILTKIGKMPVVWQENILVVDDSEPTVSLLSAILSREGQVETASNGKEALEKIKQKYYRAILTEVDLPVMDGMEFYEAAVKMYPDIKKRIIFSTGHDDPEVLSFFRENHLRYMIRPVPINEIRETVSDIMDRKKK